MSRLKGFEAFGDSTVTNDVRENLISHFDYGLLEKGAYQNVTLGEATDYGGIPSVLRSVSDPRFTDGQVWEGARGNWIWESGLGAFTNSGPAYPGVSGIYVNDVFYEPSETGSYSYHINHLLGRVVFDSPISASTSVKCEYSYKYVNVCQVDGIGWFQEIQRQSEHSEDTQTPLPLSQNRIQLPAIGIELINSRKMRPFALGGGQYVPTNFLFHCVAEDGYLRDHLLDIVTLQKDSIFNTYSSDLIAAANAFPLEYNGGVPVSGAMSYPSLISTYPGPKIRIIDVSIDSTYSLGTNLHIGTAKVSTECILFGV